MSDEEDNETREMQDMMGFAGFGSSRRPKKVPQEPSSALSANGANSTPIAKRVKTNKTSTDQRPLPGASLENTPHFTQASRYNPTQALGLFPSPAMEEGRYPQGGPAAPAKTPSPEPNSNQDPAPPAYTRDKFGVAFTTQELDELKAGKRVERGDFVYFYPTIADEDAWAPLIRAGDHIAGVTYQKIGGDKWAARIAEGNRRREAREKAAKEAAMAGVGDEGGATDKEGATDEQVVTDKESVTGKGEVTDKEGS